MFYLKGSGGRSLFFKDPRFPDFISADLLVTHVMQSRVIDLRPGGLVLGRRHEEGHVHLYETDAFDDEKGRFSMQGFRLIGLMEGGEFIMNAVASRKHEARLMEINIEPDDEVPFPQVRMNDAFRVYNAFRAEQDRWGLVDERQQFIVNRAATLRHLEELVWLNEDGRDC